MIIQTRVKGNIDPKFLSPICRAAEHKVAVQAERDTRIYIPKLTGKIVNSAQVIGKTIVWTAPYVRSMYWGWKMVDPDTGVAGFPTKDGWRSRPGVKKVKSTQKWHYTTGGARWAEESKKANVGNWLKLAEREIALHGKR